MFSRSSKFENAYRATSYLACSGFGAVTIRVGESSAGADRLLIQKEVRSAFFVTAWNPLSINRVRMFNALAQRQLMAQMDRVGFSHDFGEARSDSGDWPAGQSLLVFGPDRQLARKIGR